MFFYAISHKIKSFSRKGRTALFPVCLRWLRSAPPPHSSSFTYSSLSHSLLLGWRMTDAVITSGSQTDPLLTGGGKRNVTQPAVSGFSCTNYISYGSEGLRAAMGRAPLSLCLCVCVAVGGNRADVRRESEWGCVHWGTTETCHIDFLWSCSIGVRVSVCVCVPLMSMWACPC